MTKFKAKEFSPGLWHIINKTNNVPIHDDDKFGNDKPLVFEEDRAFEVVEELNCSHLIN